MQTKSWIYDLCRLVVCAGFAIGLVVSPIPATAQGLTPVISGTPDDTAIVGVTYSFTPMATDPTGTGLTFTIYRQPVWANFNAATGQLWGTPTAVNQGTDGGIFISAKNSSGTTSLPTF